MKNTRKAIIAVIIVVLYFTIIDASPTRLNTCDRALEDQNLPHPSECFKYYRCVYGKKVPKECPENMLFNPTIGNCDLYYNVDCPYEKITDENEQDKQNLLEAIENLTGRPFVRNPKISIVATPESSRAITNIERTITDEENPTMKFVYLPHESNPRVYYKIENGEKLLLYCAEGKIFSFDLEICAKPWSDK